MTTKAKIGPETMPSIKPELDEFIEEAVNVTNNALSPIVPMLGVVNSLINEKFTIYENAQFNKRMSRSIINRILSVETTKKFLKSQTKYSENFQDLQHQESFVKFHATLRKIKMFVEKVTQLRAFYTFLCATNIKKEFIELTKEYEACMNDLNFTMIIVFNEQRRIDNDILTDTLAKMIKDTKTSLYQEICHIKNNLEKNKDSIQQIDPILLKEPSLSRRLERRGKLKQIIKKVYKGFIEVACKSRDLMDPRFRRELLILGKLDECQNIETFYGLSKVDGKEVMIFECAEMGNLKEVYNKERISWNLKARIVFEICKGVMFLDSVGIFHNDIRCENIMMSRFMEPKLANFRIAVQHNDNKKNIAINQPTDVVNWMSPEKMHILFTESGNPNQAPYNQKCEIFSFGMIIWELAYQKIPYSNMKYNDIVVHVTKGNREICDNFLDPENKVIHESFLDIIQLVYSWFYFLPSASAIRKSSLTTAVKLYIIFAL
ncbi:kinase-like domain-containing protein [Gigaspora rosea]|uniref:Kinase-like domain-containing protein n=1 Tax=Gigaspora rosea TaxID=44941 RepID=A0A397U7H3_9GLOM|nr:kinase-like domain-containing protein [Gigaspora rosea]